MGKYVNVTPSYISAPKMTSNHVNSKVFVGSIGFPTWFYIFSLGWGFQKTNLHHSHLSYYNG